VVETSELLETFQTSFLKSYPECHQIGKSNSSLISYLVLINHNYLHRLILMGPNMLP
jgi:hypothetical protein